VRTFAHFLDSRNGMFTRLIRFLRRLGQIHPAVIAVAPDRTW